MPSKVNTKQVLYLPGLQLPPGPLFRSPEMGMRMYGLLLGPHYAMKGNETNQYTYQRWQRASNILADIFALCLGRAATFIALNNPNLSWQVVAGDIFEQHNCAMTAADAEELVTVFTAARRRFFAHPRAANAHASQPTKLTTLIDAWINTIHQTATLPAPSLLPSRPAPVETLLANFTLMATSSFPAATPSWPPAHLPATDIAFLTHPLLHTLLAGTSYRTKTPMPPLPDESSPPLALRHFLGWLVATRTPPPVKNNAGVSLYAAPVAFADNKERQAWYGPSGRQSKLFGHVDGFLEYAGERFGEGKGVVLGLLTPFFATVGEMGGLVAGGGGVEKVRGVFDGHEKLRRFGVGVMLRFVRGRGVQVVFFCPWDGHEWIREDWRGYEWRLRLWKEAVMARVDAWAEQNGVCVYEGYSGGSIMVRKDRREHDTVEMSVGWLLRVVTAMKTVPGVDEEDAAVWEDVYFFRRLENWPRVTAETGEAMDIDEDE